MTSFDAEMTLLLTGTEVEVLTRYEHRWTAGFEIASVDDDRFLLRRHSDGEVLPAALLRERASPSPLDLFFGDDFDAGGA